MDEKPYIIVCKLAQLAREVADAPTITPTEEMKMIRLSTMLEGMVVLYADTEKEVPAQYKADPGFIDGIKRSFSKLGTGQK